MSKELKCPKCQQKDKEIASLIAKLERERDILNRIFYMAKHNNGVLYFRQDDGIWKIETGEDTDVSTDGTDNNVGSMEG